MVHYMIWANVHNYNYIIHKNGIYTSQNNAEVRDKHLKSHEHLFFQASELCRPIIFFKTIMELQFIYFFPTFSLCFVILYETV